jgi:hypothetical protein
MDPSYRINKNSGRAARRGRRNKSNVRGGRSWLDIIRLRATIRKCYN